MPTAAPARWWCALAAALCACGGGEPRSGQAPSPARAEALDAQDAVRELDALGYLGSEEPAGGAVGVLVHEPDQAFAGLNFYTSGHAAEALLIDMRGRELHRWSLPFARAFPGAPPDPEAERRGRHHWRRAYLQPDGDLIAIYEGQGLVRIDAQSELVWKSELRAHHAAQVLPSGELWVLTRKAGLRRGRAIAEDFVSVLDAANGALLWETSVLAALEASPFSRLVRAGREEGDLLHTNALEMLDGRCAAAHPAFREGSVLLSSRVLSALFVLDPGPAAGGGGRITWLLQGGFRAQHDPRLLEDCRILLFDNSGAEPHSRVLELSIAPEAGAAEERVVFSGSAERRFYTKFCGAAARLPNGNTLITETGPGRAFEVTPAGAVVWEFVNPERDQDRVASIFEMVRLATESVAGWYPPATPRD